MCQRWRQSITISLLNPIFYIFFLIQEEWSTSAFWHIQSWQTSIRFNQKTVRINITRDTRQHCYRRTGPTWQVLPGSHEEMDTFRKSFQSFLKSLSLAAGPVPSLGFHTIHHAGVVEATWMTMLAWWRFTSIWETLLWFFNNCSDWGNVVRVSTAW